MASDQGKTSSILGLGILSKRPARPIPEIGVTTFRPPFTPMTFGTVAGAQKRGRFPGGAADPAMYWHVAPEDNLRAHRPLAPRLLLSKGRRGQGMRRSLARSWAVRDARRPARCLDPRQDRDQGQQDDAQLPRPHLHRRLLDPEGRALPLWPHAQRAGFIIDDGVTARLADDHFLMHTTSGGADRDRRLARRMAADRMA